MLHYVRSITPKQPPLPPLRKLDLFRDHEDFIERHECPECGDVLAYCLIHGGAMYCKRCGVSL